MLKELHTVKAFIKHGLWEQMRHQGVGIEYVLWTLLPPLHTPQPPPWNFTVFNGTSFQF